MVSEFSVALIGQTAHIYIKESCSIDMQKVTFTCTAFLKALTVRDHRIAGYECYFTLH